MNNETGIKKIKEIFCFVAENENEGEEGIIAEALDIDGEVHWYPSIGNDLYPENMKALKERSKEIANTLGKKIKLLKFTCREELEEILPD